MSGTLLPAAGRPACLVRTMPPGRDTSRSSSVVSVACALRHLDARIVGEIDVVEQRAQQRRLDALDVHHQVGDRAAEEAVGDDDRRHRRERDRVLLDRRRARRRASSTSPSSPPVVTR